MVLINLSNYILFTFYFEIDYNTTKIKKNMQNNIFLLKMENLWVIKIARQVNFCQEKI